MKNFKEGVIGEGDLIFYFDYFKSIEENKNYVINVETKRGDQFTARMIDEDGEDWYIIKQLFNNRYKRLKKESVTKIEVLELK